ncbi:MAG: hypothetical protein HY814_06990 [Candidatus Riflebacteria bacterium]|nr:hypothetical protein [Candidatus Riflebacteria bacterium]
MNIAARFSASSGRAARRCRDSRGFTLTGTAVAAVLFGMLVLIGIGFLAFGQRGTARGSTQADLQQQAMTLVYRLTQEVGEAREILLPLRAGRMYPFVALRTLDHELVLYVFQRGRGRILRQLVDPASWDPVEERLVCTDVEKAGFSVDSRGRMLRLDLTLARTVGKRKEVLPVSTGIGVRSW